MAGSELSRVAPACLPGILAAKMQPTWLLPTYPIPAATCASADVVVG